MKPPYQPPIAEYTETAESLYNAIRAIYGRLPDHVGVYKGVSAIFYRVLSQNTQFATIQFNSPYAKTSYLLRQHCADATMIKSVNDMRGRIRDFCNSPDKAAIATRLSKHSVYDIVTLCRFIALVYDVNVPLDLALIKGEPMRHAPALPSPHDHQDCLRLIVTSWDDRYIYGEADGHEGTLPVAYDHRWQGHQHCSWSYLNRLLKPNTQLNLIRPRLKEGVMVPELIIYEPDCLVNITDISSCFQPTSEDSLNNLINRLKTVEITEAILLGNFAGQLLDEEVNLPEGQHDYTESVKRFFKTNAFGLVTADISQKFHAEAKNQRNNISRAMHELPKAVRQYDKSQIVLEPSFFCQMLGLQGRVDLLQQDFSLLIEQKSGKSAFPTPTRPADCPRPTLAHMVQMLLYVMMIRYNYRTEYERNRGITSFLMYSKYDISLCGVGEALPELMFNAIKIRNAIVASDFAYANHGFGILDTLNPEYFNQKPGARRLWDQYICPQIASVLDPIKQASPLERAYFYRMMRFVANEHLLAKIGNNQNDDHGLASIWLNPLDIKLQTGNIFIGLEMVSPDHSHQGTVTEVILHYLKGEDNVMANFRKGDIVILYPYPDGSCPDACNTIITRCTISEIRSETITLHLRAPQADARLFIKPKDVLWAIEHDFTEAAFTSQYRGVHSFLNALPQRRDLLMLQRHPQVDRTVNLNGDYGAFNDLALRVKRAQDLFLIIGPPGTGKTSFGMLTTLQEQLTEPGTSVLVASYTNRAVDEICSKLVASGIDFIRIGSPISADPAYKQYFLDAKVEHCQTLARLRDTIMATRVIVGTTTAFSSNAALFSIKRFDLAIIDEASQILEPQLLPILSATYGVESAIKKFVLIGDHKQLPAVVRQSVQMSTVKEPALNAINLADCRLSLFERLLKTYGKDPDITYMLTRQGRMHREIADFPNRAFYEGRLDIVPLPHQTRQVPESRTESHGIRDMLTRRRVSFIAVNGPSEGEYVSDKVNQPEAEVIAATAVEVYRLNSDTYTVSGTLGIIVPYRNQIATVRTAIDRYGIPELHDITIDTVERFQGSERRYIIFGFTIQRYYQLQFLTANTFEEDGAYIDRKLNVAMTRAKEHLIMVGDPVLLNNDYIFYNLIAHIKASGGYCDVPVDRYVRGDF